VPQGGKRKQYKEIYNVRFEVLTAVKMSVVWVEMPHSLVSGYQCFKGMYNLHIESRSESKQGCVIYI
jgi:hypothetical protein